MDEMFPPAILSLVTKDDDDDERKTCTLNSSDLYGEHLKQETIENIMFVISSQNSLTSVLMRTQKWFPFMKKRKENERAKLESLKSAHIRISDDRKPNLIHTYLPWNRFFMLKFLFSSGSLGWKKKHVQGALDSSRRRAKPLMNSRKRFNGVECRIEAV